MKSLFAENFPKSSFGIIVRFLDPGSDCITIFSSCIAFVFNSFNLWPQTLLIELFNLRADYQRDFLLNTSDLTELKM